VKTDNLTDFPFAKVATSIATLVFISLIAISVGLPSLQPFLAILIVGILFLGIPHGALDIFLLQKISASKAELVKLIAVYCLALLAMVAAWTFVPEGAFLFFVLFSCFHFAQSDLSRKLESASLFSPTGLEFAARFLIPFFIAFGFQPERSIELAKIIHPAEVFQQLVPMFRLAGVLAVVLSGFIVLLELWFVVAKKAAWRVVSLEPVVLCLLFILLDPLYAFGIYFCFVHSVKHIFNFLTSDVQIAWKDFLPFWLLPVCGVVGLATYSRLENASIETALFKWSIIVISSMALPHAFLVYFMKKKNLLRP
jgi:Brp/Blh family beta-carotene 15,15'-monooxygenase